MKTRFLGAFEHEVNFKAFERNADLKSDLVKLAKGRVVAIVENNYKGAAGEAAFDIFGTDSGMILEALTRDASDADSGGAYDITLKTSEFSRESHLPATLFITDYDTTKAIFDGLYV